MFEFPKVIFNKESRLWRKFLRYHNRYPQVYEYFKKVTFRSLEKGGKVSGRYGVETYRWDEFERTQNKGFKVANDFSPYYTRIFIEEYPEYYDSFDLRPIKYD